MGFKNILRHRIYFDKRFYLLLILNVLIYAYAVFIYGNLDSFHASLRVLRGFLFNLGFMWLIWFVLSLITNKKAYNIAINIFVIFCMILFCIELFLLMQFDFLLNRTLMDIFLSTNQNEAKEFLDFYLNANLFDGSKSAFVPYTMGVFVLFSIIFLRLKLPIFSFYSIPVFIAAGLCFAFNVRDYKDSNSLYRLIASYKGAKDVKLTLAHRNFLETKIDSINAMKLENAGGGGNLPLS